MTPPAGPRVDYALARRAALRALDGGRSSRYDLCDAHPDLLRAARYCDRRTSDACPVCRGGPLRLVSYVFSDDLPARENGKVWTSPDVTPLLALKDARLYTVEVCLDCSWNHLRSQNVVGQAAGDSRRRAST